MDYQDALNEFGLVPDASRLDEVRQALEEEMRYRRKGQGDEYHEDLLLVLCVQLFAAGQVEDSLLIWRAKQNDFDAACYIDGRLLCGTGVEATRAFLERTHTPEARQALEYLASNSSELRDFSPPQHLDEYRRYFGLSS